MNIIIPAADQCPLETLEFRLRLTHCYPVQREDRQAVRFSHELPMHRVGHLRHVARWSYSEVIVSIIYSEAMSTTNPIPMFVDIPTIRGMFARSSGAPW